MILEELDFRRQAENLEAIAAAFEDDPRVNCPQVLHHLSSQRVLTSELIEGCKASDLQALEQFGIDPRELAERIVRAYCQMLFTDGLYHADPHPENLMIQADGGIVFLDFGAVSHPSPALRDGLPKLIEGVLRRNKEGDPRRPASNGLCNQPAPRPGGR
jgi:predicted unusual protein kinase regulating ubiquinone biosynthesis (AarF/ABC1/UbiB family)